MTKPHLTLVQNGSQGRPRPAGNAPSALSRDVDWSILMARSQQGDKLAYRHLLEQVTPYLRAIAGRSLADRSDVEDAVQDILVTVHTIRATYDPARPFGPWLVAIAKRRIVDNLRKRSRLRVRETLLDEEHEAMGEDTAPKPDAADIRSLEIAIDRLSPDQQHAIRMLKLKEMSLKEAASASGKPESLLKVTTHRAIKRLRKLMGDRTLT